MRISARWILAACGTLVTLHAVACTQHEPPSPDAQPWVALPELPSSVSLPGTTPTRTMISTAVSAPPSSPTTAVATSTSATKETPSDAPAATAASAPLEQTHELPSASGTPFAARAVLLWQAIVRDDAGLAMPFFFPLRAYEQVKDVGDPAADWSHRLVAAFRRDIHALHGRLGGDAGVAKLVLLDVPQSRARWVDPGEEWNKVGYYRVFGSKLWYEADGETRAFDVKSLISWRGEWFVVHLAAIH